MTGNEIRTAYLEFFKSKEHLILHSFPLIPENDPSLLLIGAGMAPLKPYFTGKLVPPSYRVTTSQKCIRTDDIDNVGRTARHHTFFEMLGNFSFGNYFKKEAISWAWEFLTKVLELDQSKLSVTIYPDDDEAYDYWHNMIGLPDDHIFKMDDNFWEIGEGPCGPDSEIFYDLGPERGCGKPTCTVGCDCDRYLEIWNLVFTQFNRTKDGEYVPLEKKNIDTGMGLERIASVVQEKESNFETDLIYPIIEKVIAISGGDYSKPDQKMAMKVIADHIRAVTVMIGDGILPSNEGRGYVLRRILRRAVRYGRVLGINDLFLSSLVDTVITILGAEYPELKQYESLIKRIIDTEEKQFSATLAQGLEMLQDLMNAAGDKKVLDGQSVFKLYDTFGFPVELTQEIAEENGFEIDLDGFKEAMKEQQDRARAARTKVDAKVVVPDTTKLDQSKLVNDPAAEQAQIVMIGKDGVEVETAGDGEEVTLILDANPFHAEGGGQLGDTGSIRAAGGSAAVSDAKALPNGLVYLIATVKEGAIHSGDTVQLSVDKARNLALARNHTATHLLQAALRTVLGNHVNQAGSLVTPDHLRFDFTHFSPVTAAELEKVEQLVNDEILKNDVVTIEEMPIDAAKEKGAMALFGEKYGDIVRVVSVDGFSCELCGGSHVKSTAIIGSFRILSESGTGTGVRRIEAVTGAAALQKAKEDQAVLRQLATDLKAKNSEITTKVANLMSQLKEAEKELQQLKKEAALSDLDTILASQETIGGVSVVAAETQADSMDSLRDLADTIMDKLGNGVVLLSAAHEDKINFVCKVAKADTKKGLHAGKIIKAAAQVAGGNGGGRPDMAQAGGKEPAKAGEALQAGKQLVQELLG
ncbi:alanine--tRNA ligase [Megasphaera hominis]|uniref:Alanine--tRNA ligase n=1 Tax=Megasphaera hominis TaxID=159836 RepID=A0ABR6VLD5_9FIRM|nr:alanine--tRNA ligase [Megasphaera hominis]MBC3538003.1 alanine--tRNA ligase [Megasphaera hominis]